MDSKLNCIMLIDDNPADNFIHQKVITKMDVTKQIVVAENGKKAIDYLLQKDTVQPELIFLDINMPVMDGWEFLETYENLGLRNKNQIIIAMLTTSFNPTDKKKAYNTDKISHYNHKPLNSTMLKEIIDSYFLKNRHHSL